MSIERLAYVKPVVMQLELRTDAPVTMQSQCKGPGSGPGSGGSVDGCQAPLGGTCANIS